MAIPTQSLFDIAGNVALITGASRGLGAEAARVLAEAGAHVVLLGRDRSTLEEQRVDLKQYEINTMTLRCDMGKPGEISRGVERVIKKFGKIDILVNNAGIIKRSPATEYSLSNWKDVIDVNLTGLFLMAQEVGKTMVEQRSGKIINIASLLSFSGGKLVPAYTASKHGVAGLTKALANEWAEHGVNVNAIAPGYFKTDATAPLVRDKKRFKELSDRIPAKRWGEPEDLRGTILYLASRASDYVHGHILVVDGGWMAA